MTQNKKITALLVLAATAVMAISLVVAKTLNRPLDVTMRIHIKICQKTSKGTWEVIDEVKPQRHKFKASLRELATGKDVGTDFVLRTKTKQGRSYSARVIEPAKIDVNPVTGKFKSQPVFEIQFDDRTAKVPAKYSTETVAGPMGSLRGQRAKGIFGKDRTTLKLVGVLKFQPNDKDEPLMLVSEEEYTLTPRKAQQ